MHIEQGDLNKPFSSLFLPKYKEKADETDDQNPLTSVDKMGKSILVTSHTKSGVFN